MKHLLAQHLLAQHLQPSERSVGINSCSPPRHHGATVGASLSSKTWRGFGSEAHRARRGTALESATDRCIILFYSTTPGFRVPRRPATTHAVVCSLSQADARRSIAGAAGRETRDRDRR